MEVLQPMRCRSCRRTCGIGPTDRRIYCNEFCWEFEVSKDEPRNNLMIAIWRETKATAERLTSFGVSRQRVSQILAQKP